MFSLVNPFQIPVTGSYFSPQNMTRKSVVTVDHHNKMLGPILTTQNLPSRRIRLRIGQLLSNKTHLRLPKSRRPF